MEHNEPAQNAELAQILQTLASLSRTEESLATSSNSAADRDSNQLRDSYIQSSGIQGSTPVHFHHNYGDAISKPLPSRHPVPVRAQLAISTIDTRTITEWKHGLRCVNRLANENPDFATAVQKLIRDQQRNIRDWETGRQRLIDDQASKKETEKTHRAALSLPGLLDNTLPLRTPEREEEELAEYYKKVYRATRLLTDSHSAQLISLGVPFFNVRPDLMLPDDAETSGEDMQANLSAPTKITRRQQLELQRKMLTHLMELYGD